MKNMEQKANQIRKIKILKNQSKQIISDRKIHQKVKPTLLPNLTNKLIQLVEEIEEIEKIDLQLLQDNMKQFQNKKISLTILHERENLRDEIFCLSFFTPAKTKLTSEISQLFKDNKKTFLKTHLSPKHISTQSHLNSYLFYKTKKR